MSRSRDSDTSASSSLKGRFKRPGEMDDESNNRRSNTDTASCPAWKKKEFHKPVEAEPTITGSGLETKTKKEAQDRSERKEERKRRPSTSSSSSSSSSGN
jgi:hypothetical protein